MRPVNLLPEGERPVRATGNRSGSAFVILGVLGFVLIAVVAYVLTANQVSSREQETAKAKQETEAATARANQLAAFGNFEQVKATREASVSQLAGGRFDWERTLRELARVIPAEVHVSTLDASTTGDGSAGTSGATAGAVTGPQMQLTGCAPDHRDVATLLVRLRRLHGVEDVTLTDSTKSDAGAKDTGVGDAGSSDGCAADETIFHAAILFKAPAPVAPGAKTKVPASLGGGS